MRRSRTSPTAEASSRPTSRERAHGLQPQNNDCAHSAPTFCLCNPAVDHSFGHVDSNIVWQPQNVSVDMMECPDFFPLGDKFVLLGSLFQTNQWWVGTLAGGPPRFTPEAVGILDYGNYYAAKTGSSMVQTGASRRVVFAFTGWSEPTMPRGCGRNLVFPRELRLEGSRL
eukprot:1722282-Prymnesium_polylepis.1